MDAVKRQEFMRLQAPALVPSVAPACKACAAPTRLFDAVDFNKHCGAPPYQFGLSGIMVPYYRCDSCELIFTDFIDDWSPGEIAEFIYNTDYVKVDPDYLGLRARRTAAHLAPLLAGCRDVRILDYGSGAGVFAEAMGAYGFKRVESYDPISSPARPAGTFELITCFEVLEHAPQPLDTLADIAERLSGEGAILVGQTLQPTNIEEIGGRWWYLAPRNGHVSFFTHETFVTLAARTQLRYRGGSGIFVFTRGRVAKPVRQVVQQIRRGIRTEDARQLARARGLGARLRRAIQGMRRRRAAS